MDVYASKIQLAGRAGFAGCSLEMAMKLAFVTGFPNNISKELQLALAIKTLTIGDLLTWVRVVTKDTTEDTVTTTQFPRSEGKVSFEAKLHMTWIWLECCADDNAVHYELGDLPGYSNTTSHVIMH